MTSTDVANSYLAGNFAPVREEITAFDLPVEGTIPAELNGRLIRNGPNPICIPDPLMYHWFGGDGMLHSVELREGRAAAYRNRWVRTEGVCDKLGEEPPPGPPDVVLPGTTVANTNVIVHADRILALVEVSLPTEVTPELETLGRFDYGGRLQSPMTAHPKEDPDTGELLFFGYNPIAPPYLTFHVADAEGNLVRSEDVGVSRPTMAHDFAITPTRVVFYDLPVLFDLERYMGQRPFPAGWQPETGARLGVMPRDGGAADVRWIEIEPCYVFHTLNAFDDGDRVVVDVVRYSKMFDSDIFGPGETQPELVRWTIDIEAGRVSDEVLDPRGEEFPRVSDAVQGNRHRYGYGTGVEFGEGRVQLGGLVKHDLERGTTEVRDFGPGTASSEGVFVQANGSSGEDEGYVLAVVYDAKREGSFLEIVDATDFTGRPVARVTLPQRVPFGFHGNWVPDGP